MARLIILVILGASGLQFALAFNSPTSPVPNSASHSLALTADGSLLCVVNPDSNSLTLVSTTTLTPLAEIPVGENPRKVAILGDQAFITNYGSDSISVVDLASQIHSAELPVGDHPVGIAISPDGRFLAVAETGQDTIRFLSTETLQTLVSYPVADRPYGLSFTPDGKSLLVSHLLSGIVTRLPVQPYTSYFPGIYFGMETAPETQVGSSKVPGKQSPLQPSLHGFGISIPTWPGVAPAPAVIINQSGTRAYLPQTMANGLGLNTQFDSTVFPKVSVVDLETETHLTSEHIALPELDRPVGLPWDVALTQDGRELWVVNAASDDISVIDISNPLFPTGITNINVDHNPRGILISPDGNTAYVQNSLAGSVSVIDTQSYTVVDEISTTTIPLPPVLLRGKQLFHTSSLPEVAQAAWVSCNTCHVEGENDGRTWLLQFLGEVPPGEQPVIKRNTTSLLGMIQTYPLRWSAEWDESADSEFSIRFEQFGSGLIIGEMHPTLGAPNQGRSPDLDALAAFIDSLQIPERHITLSPAEQRGKQIFESQSTDCQSCHPPPLYTDLQKHDVGTGEGLGEWFGPQFDTPTLRFLFDSPPYLHDGRSATLLDVLTSDNIGDRHGVTSHLTQQQLNNLVAFLRVLPYQ